MLILRTAVLSCRGLSALRCLSADYITSRTTTTNTQGQSPEPRIREYFYYIDHQGQVNVQTDTKNHQDTAVTNVNVLANMTLWVVLNFTAFSG